MKQTFIVKRTTRVAFKDPHISYYMGDGNWSVDPFNAATFNTYPLAESAIGVCFESNTVQNDLLSIEKFYLA